MFIEKIKKIINDQQFLDLLIKNYQSNRDFKDLVERMEANHFDFHRLVDFQSLIVKYFHSYSLCQDRTRECQQDSQGFQFILQFEHDRLFLVLKKCHHQNDLNIFQANCLIADFPQKYLTTDLKSEVKNLVNKERNDLLQWQKLLLNDLDAEKKWLVLTGNFGTGKTFLTVFFAQRFALKQQSKIIFINTSNLINKFLQKRVDQDFHLFFEQLKNIDLLVIDDFGTENRVLQFRDEFLLPILQKRFNFSRPTILISNFSFSDLKKSYLFSNDKTERIKHQTFFNLFDSGAEFLTLTTIFKG